MSGECNKCGEHYLDCKCHIIREKIWISKEEAKKIFPESDLKEFFDNRLICLDCFLWNKAAIENGRSFGMCETCFNQYFVPLKTENQHNHDYQTLNIKEID